MTDDHFVVPRKVKKRLRLEQRRAVAYSRGLRHQLRHGMTLLTDDSELCVWDGPLLPLESVDFEELIVHGTEAGYQKHRFYKIDMCEECRLAHNAMTRASKARKRAQLASNAPDDKNGGTDRSQNI